MDRTTLLLINRFFWSYFNILAVDPSNHYNTQWIQKVLRISSADLFKCKWLAVFSCSLLHKMKHRSKKYQYELHVLVKKYRIAFLICHYNASHGNYSKCKKQNCWQTPKGINSIIPYSICHTDFCVNIHACCRLKYCKKRHLSKCCYIWKSNIRTVCIFKSPF